MRLIVTLPLEPDDFIVFIHECEYGSLDGEVLVRTRTGRVFAVREVLNIDDAPSYEYREIADHSQRTS